MTIKAKCVICGAEVSEWTIDCPECGRHVANRDAPIVSDLGRSFKKRDLYNRKSKAPLVLGAAAVIMIGVSLYLMSTVRIPLLVGHMNIPEQLIYSS